VNHTISEPRTYRELRSYNEPRSYTISEPRSYIMSEPRSRAMGDQVRVHTEINGPVNLTLTLTRGYLFPPLHTRAGASRSDWEWV
jgi:hypothetical protein